MNEKIIRYSLQMLMLGVIVAYSLGALKIPAIDSLERVLYDTRLRMTMPRTVDDRIVILDIDEKSLAQVGRWPWGRDRMAQLMDTLFDRYHVAEVGFDIVMGEPDLSSGLPVLEKLGQNQLRNDRQYLSALDKLKPQLNYDEMFAASLKDRPVILGYYVSDQNKSTGVTPKPVLDQQAFGSRKFPVYTYTSYGGNLPVFQQAALSGGHFDPVVDEDGIVRRVPMLVKMNGAYYESLSLAMARVLLGSPEIQPSFGAKKLDSDPDSIDWLDLNTEQGTVSIPVVDGVTALVPYRSEKGFRYLSIADVFTGSIKPEQLEGKIVLIGTSAPGLRDVRASPVGQEYPGVEIHANLISGMIDGTIKKKPAYANAIELLLLLITGAVMIFLFPWHHPIRAVLATLVALSVVIGTNMFFWVHSNEVIALAASLLLVATLFVLSMSYGYFVESRSKRRFTLLFGQYVPPELVQEMSRDPEKYSMAGRKAELTVMFSDIRGFTTLSESMEPDQLANLMNEYLTAMTQVVRKHRGTLDKYIGDAIMAFWGAPLEDAEHARHAILTALDMQEALVSLNASLEARGMPTIKIGIGINTGIMTVGDMGSVIRKAYTVMGDAVNLSSRLEGITKQYGVGIVAGEDTAHAVKDVIFRELDLVQVKGKAIPVKIYEPIGLQDAVSDEKHAELALWQQVLQHYRNQQWDKASDSLAELSYTYPNCELYKIYWERIEQMRKHSLIPDWDGVMRFETK